MGERFVVYLDGKALAQFDVEGQAKTMARNLQKALPDHRVQIGRDKA